ncbi:MAG: hypothetical protein AAGI90_02320 [Chlamydiota bacterium]
MFEIDDVLDREETLLPAIPLPEISGIAHVEESSPYVPLAQNALSHLLQAGQAKTNSSIFSLHSSQTHPLQNRIDQEENPTPIPSSIADHLRSSFQKAPSVFALAKETAEEAAPSSPSGQDQTEEFPPELFEDLADLTESIAKNRSATSEEMHTNISKAINRLYDKYKLIFEKLRERKALKESQKKAQFKEAGRKKGDISFRNVWITLMATGVTIAAAGIGLTVKTDGALNDLMKGMTDSEKGRAMMINNFKKGLQSVLQNGSNSFRQILENSWVQPPYQELEAKYQILLQELQNSAQDQGPQNMGERFLNAIDKANQAENYFTRH